MSEYEKLLAGLRLHAAEVADIDTQPSMLFDRALDRLKWQRDGPEVQAAKGGLPRCCRALAGQNTQQHVSKNSVLAYSRVAHRAAARW